MPEEVCSLVGFVAWMACSSAMICGRRKGGFGLLVAEAARQNTLPCICVKCTAVGQDSAGIVVK
jgi:hypothetical protein